MARGLSDRYMADRRIGKDNPFQLNEVRGKLFKVPKGQTKAEDHCRRPGRLGRLVGAAQAQRQPYRHREHGARGRGVEFADVLAVVEAKDRIALQRFNDNYLVPQGVGLLYNMPWVDLP